MFVRNFLRLQTVVSNEKLGAFFLRSSYSRSVSTVMPHGSKTIQNSRRNKKVSFPILTKEATRHLSTSVEGTIINRIKHIFGLGKLPKSISRAVGYKLYESIELQVNHNKFFQDLNLPDTFHSWFVVKSLHVWMLMVRLMQEGEEGRLVRNALVEAMWEDVDFKSKQLGELASSVRKKQIQELVNEFQASLFSYDEGLLTTDTVLAGAIWRHLYGQEEFEPKHLSLLVEYVRQNISKLDSLSYEDLLDKRSVEWARLDMNL